MVWGEGDSYGCPTKEKCLIDGLLQGTNTPTITFPLLGAHFIKETILRA